jgi:hypothetical protein
MDLDDDIKKKHDLRTVEGRKNAEHEQLERSTWIGKFFKLVWFLIKCVIVLGILGGIATFIETGSL